MILSRCRLLSVRFALVAVVLQPVSLMLVGPISARAEALDWQIMADRVDELLGDSWKQHDIQPAQPADESEFLRRVYVDLTGVVPTAGEARDYLSATDVDKRMKLIDRLLNSPRHATHLATTWRNTMLPADFDFQLLQSAAGLQDWLRRQFVDNLRYDRIVAELMAASGNEQTGPALYFRSLELKPEKLAANTSRTFLGVQMQCAQCHDHPFDHWTQKDFWGYAAFFAQLRQPSDGQPIRGGEFELVDLDEGEVTLPDQDKIVPPTYPGGRIAASQDGGTRRQQLAIWMASRDNPYLPRAAVNRVWAHLFGRGIVDPVDEMSPSNEPSHPELLNELSNYFIEAGLDLRGLYRTLANTKAYQLSSRSTGKELPADLFAQMQVKVMTAEQLYDSLAHMLSDGDQPQNFGPVQNNPLFEPRRLMFVARMDSASRNATEYRAGLQQALTMMNGDLIGEATDLERSRLLTSLEAPFFSDGQRVDTLFLAALARLPSVEERDAFIQHVRDAQSDALRRHALSDILWALVNSGEFVLVR